MHGCLYEPVTTRKRRVRSFRQAHVFRLLSVAVQANQNGGAVFRLVVEHALVPFLEKNKASAFMVTPNALHGGIHALLLFVCSWVTGLVLWQHTKMCPNSPSGNPP